MKTYAECDDARLEAFAESMRVTLGVAAVSLSPGYGYLFVDHDDSIDLAAMAVLAEGLGYVVESEAVSPARSSAVPAAAFAVALVAFSCVNFSTAHAGARTASVQTSRTSAFVYARQLSR